jgi:hypothetical protein
MSIRHRDIEDDTTLELSLLMETAMDLVRHLRDLSDSVEKSLGRAADADTLVRLLRLKKEKVDTLNAVAREITARLQLGSDGRPGIVVPENIKVGFYDLMAEFQRLLEEESRIANLISGQGFPISLRNR